jgi:hypothetical protein
MFRIFAFAIDRASPSHAQSGRIHTRWTLSGEGNHFFTLFGLLMNMRWIQSPNQLINRDSFPHHTRDASIRPPLNTHHDKILSEIQMFTVHDRDANPASRDLFKPGAMMDTKSTMKKQSDGSAPNFPRVVPGAIHSIVDSRKTLAWQTVSLSRLTPNPISQPPHQPYRLPNPGLKD